MQSPTNLHELSTFVYSTDSTTAAIAASYSTELSVRAHRTRSLRSSGTIFIWPPQSGQLERRRSPQLSTGQPGRRIVSGRGIRKERNKQVGELTGGQYSPTDVNAKSRALLHESGMLTSVFR